MDEIEKLVVRLLLESKQYEKETEKVERLVKRLSASVETEAAKIATAQNNNANRLARIWEKQNRMYEASTKRQEAASTRFWNKQTSDMNKAVNEWERTEQQKQNNAISNANSLARTWERQNKQQEQSEKKAANDTIRRANELARAWEKQNRDQEKVAKANENYWKKQSKDADRAVANWQASEDKKAAATIANANRLARAWEKQNRQQEQDQKKAEAENMKYWANEARLMDNAIKENEQLLSKFRNATERDLGRVAQLTQEAATPLDNYKSRIKEVNDLKAKGYVTGQLYQRTIQQIGRDYFVAAVQGNVLANTLDTIGYKMTQAGRAMSVGVTAPVVAGGLFSAKEFGAFQQGLLDIEATMAPTAQQMEMMRQSGMRLSRDLKTAPSAILTGFNDLLKAGMEVEDVLDGAGKSAVEFARIGGMHINTAATVMSDAAHQFGTGPAETVDTLSAAADASSVSVQQIAESFSQASAAAVLADQNLLDLSTAIAILGKNGIKGSDAGTSIRTMSIRLAAPVEKAADTIKRFNIQLRDGTGRMLPYRDAIEELNKKLGHLNKEVRDRALVDIFGQDAIRSSTILMREGTEGWDAMIQRQKEATSVAEKYQKVQSGLNGTWQGFRAAIDRLQIAIGGQMERSLLKLLQYVTDITEATTEWVKTHPTLATMLGILAATAAAVGPILIVLGLMAGAVSNVIIAVNAFSAALVLLEGSMLGMQVATLSLKAGLAGLAIAGIAALSYAIYKLNTDVQNFNKAVSDSNFLAYESMKKLQKQRDEMLKQAEQMAEAERRIFLTDELTKAEQELKGVFENLEGAAERFQKLNSPWNAWIGNKDLEAAEAEMKQMQTRFDETHKTVEALQGALDKLNGNTEEQKQKQLELAQAAGAELANDVYNLTIRLEEQAAVLGMTSTAAEIHKLKLRGAADEQLAMALAASKTIDAFEAQQKAEKKAEQLMKKHMSPKDKYLQEYKEIQDLQDQGRLSADTYAAAMKELRQEFGKDVTVKFRALGIDAVLADSNEAAQRLQKYREMLMAPDLPEPPKEEFGGFVGVGGPQPGMGGPWDPLNTGGPMAAGGPVKAEPIGTGGIAVSDNRPTLPKDRTEEHYTRVEELLAMIAENTEDDVQLAEAGLRA